MIPKNLDKFISKKEITIFRKKLRNKQVNNTLNRYLLGKLRGNSVGQSIIATRYGYRRQGPTHHSIQLTFLPQYIHAKSPNNNNICILQHFNKSPYANNLHHAQLYTFNGTQDLRIYY